VDEIFDVQWESKAQSDGNNSNRCVIATFPSVVNIETSSLHVKYIHKMSFKENFCRFKIANINVCNLRNYGVRCNNAVDHGV